MGCFIRYRSLIFGLLLCLITISNSIADANNVKGNIQKNKLVIGDKQGVNENDILRTDQISRGRRSAKWLRGRKMGAHQGVKMEEEEKKDQVMVQVKGRVETGANPCAGKCEHDQGNLLGKVNISSKKTLDRSSKDSRKTKRKHSRHSSHSTGSKMNAKQNPNKKGATNTLHHESNDHDDEVQKMLMNAKQNPNKKGATNTLHHESNDHDDEVQKMFNMLNKDYQSKGRRRSPINNNIPVHAVDGRQP